MVDADAIRQRWEAVGSSSTSEDGGCLRRRRRGPLGGAASRWSRRSPGSPVRRSIAAKMISTREPLPKGRVRRAGGGRRALCDTDPGLVPALKRLVQPATLGDPMRPLIWVSKSLEKLAAALTEMGHPIGPDTVRKELVKLGFSRQSNRKADEGSHHPDRNAQFEYINAKVVAAQARQQPVISVDTKKKELIGNFKNGGTDYRPKRKPRRVNVHDFEDKKRGKVVPYGVYDVSANAGFVSLGITSDTAEFAVQSIRCWRRRMGRQRYPKARELTITADCGGSNGARVRLWKRRTAKARRRDRARDPRPPLSARHIEVEQDRAPAVLPHHAELARPAADRSPAVVELIGATTTKAGLKVECALDTRTYQKGIKVSNAEMKALDIAGDRFHPEWNYKITPRTPYLGTPAETVAVILREVLD